MSDETVSVASLSGFLALAAILACLSFVLA